MNKRELIELLDIYHDEDEITVLSSSGRTGWIKGLNFEEMNRTGSIVLELGFNHKEVKPRPDKVYPDSQEVRAVYTYQAKKKLPWAVRFARVSEKMMIGFSSEEAYRTWMNERLKQKRDEKSVRDDNEEL